MARDEILDEGLRLIDEGRQMFLLGAGKRPVANCPECPEAGPNHPGDECGHLLCHGFYAATNDPDRFREIRRAVPRGMLAVRTGAASDLVIVDGDPRHGAQLDPVLMPPTRYVITGSDGWHGWYWHPGVPIPNSASRIGPGIDIRGDGGYAVCPPSVHPRSGRPYRWINSYPMREMPAALVKACLPPRTAVASGDATWSTTTAEGISRPDRLLAALVDAVDRAPEGRRRVTLYGVSRGFARMVAAGAISRADAWSVLTDAGRRAEQTERDIRRAIEGGFHAEGIAA